MAIAAGRRAIASLKVPWRRDPTLDESLTRGKHHRTVARVVREIVLSRGRCLPLRYLEKRRVRLRLKHHAATFLRQHPNLFTQYLDRIKPAGPLVPFIKPSPSLQAFLDTADELKCELKPLAVAKLAKLLMMAPSRGIAICKIAATKRDFGLPDDFLDSVVAENPQMFRVVGGLKNDNGYGNEDAFLELIEWKEEHAKSMVEINADRDAEETGIRMRPNFSVRLPPGFFLKKEMREWLQDWFELPYISPYVDSTRLDPASPEAEKRAVGVLHELLSLTVEKRMTVPIVGKFAKDFGLSNRFFTAFTRHPGIFYLCLKGGVQTAILREAYDEKGELICKDPMLQVKEMFVALVDEGHNEYLEGLKRRREQLQKDRELMEEMNKDDEVRPEQEDEGDDEGNWSESGRDEVDKESLW